MKLPEIRQHYTSLILEEIAQKLPRRDAFRMYETTESIARIILGETAFCTNAVTDPVMKILAMKHLKEGEEWVNYLLEQRQKYKE